jgi:hypothetical protein
MQTSGSGAACMHDPILRITDRWLSADALSTGIHYLCDPDDRNTLATITTSSAMNARRYLIRIKIPCYKDTLFMAFVRPTHVFGLCRNGIA